MNGGGIEQIHLALNERVEVLCGACGAAIVMCAQCVRQHDQLEVSHNIRYAVGASVRVHGAHSAEHGAS
jgi:hypothetical protein